VLVLALAVAVQVAGSAPQLTDSLVRRAAEAAVASVADYPAACPASAPPHGALRLLLADQARRQDPERLRLLERFLEGTARGCLRDHLAGGFYRGVGEPGDSASCFEKRLCDNALLLRVLARVQGMTRSLLIRDVARELVSWSIREMHDSSGAFWSSIAGRSEDGDRDYYLWSREQIFEALGPERAAEYLRTYRLCPPGLLVLEGSPFAGLDPSREVLLGRRVRRVRPAVDQSIRPAWNGLMISGLAATGAVLKRGADLEGARRAASAVLELLDTKNVQHQAPTRAAAFEDCAYLAEGLLDLNEATGEPRWRTEVIRLVDTAVSRFWDVPSGAFVGEAPSEGAAGAPGAVARSSGARDRNLPSASGVMASVLVRLGRLTGERRYTALARRVIEVALPEIERAPLGMETMTAAAADWLRIQAPAETPAATGQPAPKRPPSKNP
jgi:uncharacterized protein